VKKPTSSWKIALFTLGVVISCINATESWAFTLIETQFLPAVQLGASQSAQIKVTNTSSNNLDVVITTFNDGGARLSQTSVTILPLHTQTVAVKSGATGPLSFRATLALSAANSSVADVMMFDKTTGQLVVVLPFVVLPNP